MPACVVPTSKNATGHQKKHDRVAFNVNAVGDVIDIAIMVCRGPDPPEHEPQELTPPAMSSLATEGPPEDSDEELTEFYGYEPLPQAPEDVPNNGSSDDDEEMVEQATPMGNVPLIEPMDRVLTREVWNTPREADPIQMDPDKAQAVMSAMANFVLPQNAIPQWAQSVTEEQWKKTLDEQINRLRKK